MTPGAAGTASYRTRGETVAQDETNVAARLAEALTESELVHSIFIDPIARALLPVVRELQAEAWDEGCEAGADHAANNGRLGLPHDPPSNPYDAAALRGEAGR